MPTVQRTELKGNLAAASCGVFERKGQRVTKVEHDWKVYNGQWSYKSKIISTSLVKPGGKAFICTSLSIVKVHFPLLHISKPISECHTVGCFHRLSDQHTGHAERFVRTIPASVNNPDKANSNLLLHSRKCFENMRNSQHFRSWNVCLKRVCHRDVTWNLRDLIHNIGESSVPCKLRKTDYLFTWTANIKNLLKIFSRRSSLQSSIKIWPHLGS